MPIAEKESTLRERVRTHYMNGITDPDRIAAMLDVRNAGDELIHECIREAIVSESGKVQHGIRNSWKVESVRPSTVNVSAAMESAKVRARRLFDSWIVAGTPLGRCVKGDLQEAAAIERGAARGHHVNAAFYESLAGRLSGQKMVENAMSEEEALELLKAAQAA